MPGMTTMPILQSAPPANSNAKSLNGTLAPANIADKQRTSVSASDPRTANTGNTSSTDAISGGEPGNAPDSFADALERQLSQGIPRDTPTPDFVPLADLTLPVQPEPGLLTAASSQPVSVETLLSDLSDFVDRLSLHGSSPIPVSAGLGTATDLQIRSAVAEAAHISLKTLPVGTVEAIDVANTNAVSQVFDSDEDTPEEMSPDGLASIAPLIQSLQPNQTIAPVLEVAVEGERLAAARLPPMPVLPTSAIANPNMDMATASPTPPELLPKAATSAEFAAAQASLTEAASPEVSHSAAVEPERSFDSSLAVAQAVSQHRNSGVHAPASTPQAIQTPVGTHGWDGEVADKLVWMIGRQEQRAELVLNPPQMGRIEVSLSINDGQTSALFVSANPAVRDALEAGLPRLREILADAGVNLGQTQVGADSGNNAGNPSTNNAENRDNSGRGLSNNEKSPSQEVLRQLDAPQWLKRGNGLVDIFA